MRKLTKIMSLTICLVMICALLSPMSLAAQTTSDDAIEPDLTGQRSNIPELDLSLQLPNDNSIDGTGTLSYYYSNGDGVNIRTGAGTSYTSFGQLQKGDLVEQQYPYTSITSNGYVWIQVKVISTVSSSNSSLIGKIGWVAKTYLTSVYY